MKSDKPIGDYRAFPRPEGVFDATSQDGMTYRQWLIGQALASGRYGVHETAELMMVVNYILKDLERQP